MTKKIYSKITFFLMLSFLSITAQAEDNYNLSFGAKLLSANWKGENTNSNTEFERDVGGQFAWNVALQKGKFYSGLSLQSGNYHFKNSGPDQITGNTTVAVTDVKVQRSELDLLAGYYFWDNISLFLDLKSVQNKHNKNNYKQNFTGLGFGVAGAWSLNDKWSLYGTYGFVAKGDLKADDKSIGSATGAALEFGSVYRFAESHRINFGLKSQGQKYTFNNGTSQTHNFSGLFIGYNYLLSL